MATNTTYMNLIKPELTDVADIASINTNMDTIDAKLGLIEAGAEVNVQSDWNAASGDAQILNKPTIPDAVTVVDNLTSTSTTSALSANQGKVLNDGKENALTTIVSVDASKTLALTDAGKLQLCTHATTAINLTVPPNSAVAFPTGTVIPIKQNGAAAVAVVQGSGVTINPSTKLKINAQYESAVLVKEATDTWGFIGSIKA